MESISATIMVKSGGMAMNTPARLENGDILIDSDNCLPIFTFQKTLRSHWLRFFVVATCPCSLVL
jgi:hypothetical protein